MAVYACPTTLPSASWIFADSDEGGRRAAVINTLIAAAMLNDIDQQAWLGDVARPLARSPGQADRRTIALARVWIMPACCLTSSSPCAMMTSCEVVMRAQAHTYEIPLDRVDLEALDCFLMSERAPSESMMLSDLDGFLTGFALRPELVMPSEWLPIIFGGDAPEFADEVQAKATRRDYGSL